MKNIEDYVEDAMDDMVTDPDLFIEALSQQPDALIIKLGEHVRDENASEVMRLLSSIMDSYFQETAWRKAEESYRDYQQDCADMAYEM